MIHGLALFFVIASCLAALAVCWLAVTGHRGASRMERATRSEETARNYRTGSGDCGPE